MSENDSAVTKYLESNDITVTKFLEAAISSLLLDDRAVTKFLEDNDISVTKFLAQEDNIAIDQDDQMLMIEFNLEHEDNDISVTKFLDESMARYLQ